MERNFKKYLNGNCNPIEYQEVLSQLSNDGNNDKIAVLFSEHWHNINHFEVDDRENPQLLALIHHRIAIEESKINTKHFNLFRNLLKIAAIFIAALLVLSGYLFHHFEKEVYVDADVIENVTTPNGAKTNFTLPDGSIVWLNSSSTLTYKRKFGEIRDISLNGQAYFSVVKDGKPFVVSTKYGKVEVMGTSFDVKAFENDDFETTLVSGSVKVRNIDNQTIMLMPGQQSVIDANNKLILKEVDVSLYTSWKDGQLIFDNEPLEKVVKMLERWYNVKIVLEGNSLKKLGYTGTIELESFGEVLDLIKATTPIKYKFDKESRILTIREN